MFKYLSFLFLIIITHHTAHSQEKRDLGLQLGGSYYIGDYNLGTQLYQPLTAIGVIYKYNFNNFYTARVSAIYGGLRGSYNPSSHFLPGKTGSFSKRLIEAEALSEINLLAFDTHQYKKENFTPYVIVGIGVAYVDGQIMPHFPFGIGIKICTGSRTAVGVEWRMHKTITDSIDSYENPDGGRKAILHNNDWFSFAGLFLTYRLYNNGYTCPAYR